MPLTDEFCKRLFQHADPFEDGNGRVGRLLLNLLLMREGYPPAFLLRSWAERYRNALSSADHGRYTPLVNLVGQAVEAGLDFYLEACAAVAEEHYRPLAELARATGRDPNYLGLLVRQGKLEAKKRGGRWYATPAALSRYEQQVREGRVRRGRPPRTDSPKDTPGAERARGVISGRFAAARRHFSELPMKSVAESLQKKKQKFAT